MNEVLENIKCRRSTRKFTKEKVEKSVLKKILEAGQYAPSGGNNQSSHIMVIRDNKILKGIKSEVKEAFAQMEIVEGQYKSLTMAIKASQKEDYDFIYHAPTLVIVTNQIEYGNGMADSACVLMNMMLAATSLDVASCWINQLKWLRENPKIREKMLAMGMEDSETVYGALALGYPEKRHKKPLERTGNKITWVE